MSNASISNLSQKALFVILDGFSLAPNKLQNAVEAAKTPNIDSLMANFPNTSIEPGGELVGLPKGIMGNSEVGHMNLGAGRPVRQDLVIINEAIEKDQFKDQEKFQQLINYAKAGTKRIHLLGLLSDGGVHSHIDHLIYVHQQLQKYPELEVYFHAFSDGRDTSNKMGIKYLKTIDDLGIKVASIQGRSIGMDRDRRWEKIEHAYKTFIGEGDKTKSTAIQYIQKKYDEEVYDEFITPTLLLEEGKIQENDSVFFLNFRPDRAIQITQAFTLDDFSEFDRPVRPGMYLCMTPYIPDEIDLPIVFNKEKLTGTLSEYLSSLGKKQLKIAETEKYAHVTFFFNGGEKKPFPNEEHLLVPSPKEVETYDQKPEMSAHLVTEKLVDKIQGDEFDFYVVNFANCDMVGHTGSFNAAVKAVEAVDSCVGTLFELCTQKNLPLILTADHGNCEQMTYEDGSPHTSHTNSLVPFIVAHSSLKNKSVVKNDKKKLSLQDVAPTILNIMGLKTPNDFKGQSIFL